MHDADENRALILEGVAILQRKLAEGNIPAEQVRDVEMGVALMQIMANGAT